MSVIDAKNWRAIVSPAVAITFVAVAGTGVLMLCDLKGGGLRGLHEIGGVLFAAACLIHLIINWQPLLACFRRPVALVSLALAAAALILTLASSGREHEGDRHHGGPRVQDGTRGGARR